VSDELAVGLEELRGDNGNGKVFQITSVNGFDESSTRRHDDGRLNFEEMNRWFVQLGFVETKISKFKNRPIHQFEKIVRNSDGGEILVRVTRLLADTDLEEGNRVTFAKFLKNAIKTSDVVVYEGHSGMGASLSLEAVEKRAGGKIEFDRKKHQMFFFDACSSYSYYLGLFTGRKEPGTLAVITNGIASLFGSEIPVTRRFYKALISSKNDDLRWTDLLEDMERPLRSNSFLLNVDLNLSDQGQLQRLSSQHW
jgi:hypothetical protein